MSKRIALRSVGMGTVCLIGAVATVRAQEAARQTDVAALKLLSEELAVRDEVERAAALRWAQEVGFTRVWAEGPSGRVTALIALRKGRPVFYQTNIRRSQRPGP